MNISPGNRGKNKNPSLKEKNGCLLQQTPVGKKHYAWKP